MGVGGEFARREVTRGGECDEEMCDDFGGWGVLVCRRLDPSVVRASPLMFDAA